MDISETLLGSVKDYLNITWSDPVTDKKISGIISRGMNYINEVAGETLDYEVEKKAKELLLEYCLYVRSNALSDFSINYLPELLALQRSCDTARYEKKGQLISLQIGDLELSPVFSSKVKEYQTSSNNSYDVVNVVPFDTGASIQIILNSSKVINNGSSILWEPGRNVLDIKVCKDLLTVSYTITVFKS